MDYEKIYYNLIQKCKRNTYGVDTYTERHHIIPRCLGGGDDETNIVTMNASEHYIAHQLLLKIHKSNHQLACAAMLMSSGLCKRNNKNYKWIKEKWMKNISLTIKNAWAKKRGFVDYYNQCAVVWDEYAKCLSVKKVSDDLRVPVGNINRCLRFWAEETQQDLSVLRFKSKSLLSQEIRKNISPEKERARIEATKNADYSCREAWWITEGKCNPGRRDWNLATVVMCPHCMKENRDTPSFRRWHFNNCSKRIKDDK